jgi:hypothetical protein
VCRRSKTISPVGEVKFINISANFYVVASLHLSWNVRKKFLTKNMIVLKTSRRDISTKKELFMPYFLYDTTFENYILVSRV